MDEYLDALAQSFVNMGIKAESYGTSIMVNGCRFYAERVRRARNTFTIGIVRLTKRSPMILGITEIMRLMPGKLAQKARQEAAKTCAAQATELTKEFNGVLTISSYNYKLDLAFTHVDPTLMEEVCQRIKSLVSLPFDLTDPNERAVAAYHKWAEELRK